MQTSCIYGALKTLLTHESKMLKIRCYMFVLNRHDEICEETCALSANKFTLLGNMFHQNVDKQKQSKDLFLSSEQTDFRISD